MSAECVERSDERDEIAERQQQVGADARGEAQGLRGGEEQAWPHPSHVRPHLFVEARANLRHEQGDSDDAGYCRNPDEQIRRSGTILKRLMPEPVRRPKMIEQRDGGDDVHDLRQGNRGGDRTSVDVLASEIAGVDRDVAHGWRHRHADVRGRQLDEEAANE